MCIDVKRKCVGMMCRCVPTMCKSVHTMCKCVGKFRHIVQTWLDYNQDNLLMSTPNSNKGLFRVIFMGWAIRREKIFTEKFHKYQESREVSPLPPAHTPSHVPDSNYKER